MPAVQRVIVFNRYSIVDVSSPNLASRLNAATVEMLNWYGDAVGRYTLNGNAVQTNVITLFPPTPSQTATASGTASPSQTGTQTSSASATVSTGAQPSSTGTPTLSGTGERPTTPRALKKIRKGPAAL